MAKRKQQPPDEGSPAWMSTFSDLMNLLLCFFVLLFASSTMDEGKIQKIAASFDNLSFSVISEGSVSLLTGEMLSGGMTQLADTDSVLSEAGKNIDGNTGDNASSASPTDAGIYQTMNCRRKLTDVGRNSQKRCMKKSCRWQKPMRLMIK